MKDRKTQKILAETKGNPPHHLDPAEEAQVALLPQNPDLYFLKISY